MRVLVDMTLRWAFGWVGSWRRAQTVLLLLALGVGLGSGCRRREGATPPARATAAAYVPKRVAEIYFSTDVYGYIEPCGCTTEPLGGLPRLASVVLGGHKNRALLDAGNFLFPKEGLSEVTKEQHLLKARMLARAYRQLGVAAVNLAELDFSAGLTFLETLKQEGAFPLVSANVRPEADKPDVARSFLRRIGAIHFGITGVATPENIAALKLPVAAIEYAPQLALEVRHLIKKGAEVVIVLAQVGEEGARALARAVPDIDIIIRGPGTPIERAPSTPVRAEGVIIVEAGQQGQHVGRMRFSLGAAMPTKPITLDDGGARAKKRRELIARQIKAYSTELEAWKTQPEKAGAARAKAEQIQRLKAKLAVPLPSPKSPEKPHVRIDLVRLDGKVADDGGTKALLEAYYAQLKAFNLEKGNLELCVRPNKSVPTYVGTKKCAPCHQPAYQFWKRTKHARAWATLEDQNKHYDLTCVGCHVVGYEKPGGFCRLKDVGPFQDVGCENCHGPGSAHVSGGGKAAIVRRTTEATCASHCHVPEHSDAFVYETYLRKITGPGHVLSSASK